MPFAQQRAPGRVVARTPPVRDNARVAGWVAVLVDNRELVRFARLREGDSGVLNFDATHNRAIAKYTAETPHGFPNPSFPDMFVTPEVHGRQLGFCVEPMYHFAECLRTGTKPLTRGEDGLLNTRILVAAEESVRTGLPVDLS